MVVSYPFLIFIVPEPVAWRRGRKHASARQAWQSVVRGDMPPSLRDLSERNGRRLLLAKFGMEAIFLYFWARSQSITLQDIGWGIDRSLRESLLGVIAAAFLISGRLVFEGLNPRVRQLLSQHPLARGPAGFWVIVALVGGAAEEPWRAFSLLALQRVDLGTSSAILVTSLAFSFAHLAGIPARIPGRPSSWAIWEMALGAFLAWLFLTSNSLTAPLIASVIFHLANLYLIRRRVGWDCVR